MLYRCLGLGQTDFLTQLCERRFRPIAGLNVTLQPWLKLSIACLCLVLGLDVCHSEPLLITLVGYALLLRVPTYAWLAWRDYRAIKEARFALMLRRRLDSPSRDRAMKAA
jgi:Flp pilus assembly protein TadB